MVAVGGAPRTAGNTVARMLDVIRTSSSAPAYIEAGDGALYILKLSGAGAGERGLLTEFLATGLAGGETQTQGVRALVEWLGRVFPQG